MNPPRGMARVVFHNKTRVPSWFPYIIALSDTNCFSVYFHYLSFQKPFPSNKFISDIDLKHLFPSLRQAPFQAATAPQSKSCTRASTRCVAPEPSPSISSTPAVSNLIDKLYVEDPEFPICSCTRRGCCKYQCSGRNE